MRYFSGISDINSLTLIYRRLAMLNHPDMGGNPEVMKRINIEYEELKSQLKGGKKEKSGYTINQPVFVNKSPARIIHIGDFIIIVQSELTNRKAIFNKKSGTCLSNPELKLSTKEGNIMSDDNLKIHTGFRISKSNLDFIENTGKNLGLTKTGVVDMFITILRNNPNDLALLIQKAVKNTK